MKTTIKTALFAMVTILFVQCDNKFEVSKGRVGKLTTKTKITELSNIFKNDSIVKNLSEGEKGNGYLQEDDEYLIYDKNGKHLLTITAEQALDSTSTIKCIEIFDPRYKTKNGLNINSTFQEINANTPVKSEDIEILISSVKIPLRDLDAEITLDKEDLGLEQFGNYQQISPEQIPDLAKVKSFIVWFN